MLESNEIKLTFYAFFEHKKPPNLIEALVVCFLMF